MSQERNSLQHRALGDGAFCIAIVTVNSLFCFVDDHLDALFFEVADMLEPFVPQRIKLRRLYIAKREIL